MKRFCLILVWGIQFFIASAQSETNIHEEKGTLPVMFDSVRAVVKNDLVQIGWSNLTERDVDFYMIEHSVDGTHFTPLYQQMPASNLNEKASYSFLDTKAADGANYYRIKVTINTGRIISSRILKAHMGFMNPGFTLYPNPVTGNECTISMAAVRKGIYTLEVINNAGLRIHQSVLNNQADGVTQELNLPGGMMPGIYIARITGEDYMASQLFIKK